MNRHSRKDAGQKTGQHIPEEVLHGHNLLSEDVPTARNLYQNITPIKAGLRMEPAIAVYTALTFLERMPIKKG